MEEKKIDLILPKKEIISDVDKYKSITMIPPKSVEDVSASGETHLFLEPYMFEVKALERVWGAYFTSKKYKKVRDCIWDGWKKIRPNEKIEEIAKIGEEKKLDEEYLSRVVAKYILKWEEGFELKYKSIDGRKEEEFNNDKSGVDNRWTVDYSVDYQDPWENPNWMSPFGRDDK